MCVIDMIAWLDLKEVVFGFQTEEERILQNSEMKVKIR